MSRLYGYMVSDTLKNAQTCRAHEAVSARLNWGGADNSKRAVEVNLVWKGEDEEPVVIVEIARGVRYSVAANGRYLVSGTGR